jgi:CheY-like chemotaxis protein
MGSLKAYAARFKIGPPRPVRVLVVDDEEPVRSFVERVLHEAGYVTSVAAEATQALQIAESSPPFEILVTDLVMPHINGDELARRMRLEEPSLKVLYLTGFSDRLFKERSSLWEDEAFLEKPCSIKGLLQAVSLLHTGKIELPPAS